ncbi:hypothetical protein RhiirA1_355369, partial [Rhizophagus irregularis]
VCRFGYPKEIVERTFVRDDSRGQLELVTARNDQYINLHSQLQLQGWRANVDLKPILTIHAALQYISKYASKAEPRSAAFSDILIRILSESQPEDPLLAPCQRENIVRIFPRPSPIREGPQWEEFCRVKVVLHVHADTFVNRISRIDDEEENIIVDYQTLNNNQKILFRRIESHYHDALAGRKVEPLRIIVMGTAGTGKTYLIKAIRYHWKILTTRIEDKIGITDRNSFSDALVLLTKWSEVNAVNMDRLRSLDVPVAKIQAIHSGGNEAKNASSDTAHGLEVNILLARGARVMLTANLQTESGLVNGSIGTV